MTTLEVIFVMIIMFAQGIWLGWQLREWHAIRTLRRFLSENEPSENAPETAPEIVSCVLEQHGNVFYVYSKEDNQFLGQGTDENELSVVLKERFPGKMFSLDGDQLKKLRGSNNAKSI